jgi:hypothetical protein
MAPVRRGQRATTCAWLDRPRAPRHGPAVLRCDRNPVGDAAHRATAPLGQGEGRLAAVLGWVDTPRKRDRDLAAARDPGDAGESVGRRGIGAIAANRIPGESPCRARVPGSRSPLVGLGNPVGRSRSGQDGFVQDRRARMTGTWLGKPVFPTSDVAVWHPSPASDAIHADSDPRSASARRFRPTTPAPDARCLEIWPGGPDGHPRHVREGLHHRASGRFAAVGQNVPP